MKMKCERCLKELQEGEIKCFGSYESNKKVWCTICWEDLQKYIKQRRQEEKVPELKEQAKTLLSECELNKKKFLNIIKECKEFIKKIESEFINNDNIEMTEQKELIFDE